MAAKVISKPFWISALKYVGRGALGAVGAIIVYILAIWVIYKYAGNTIAANLLAMKTQPNNIATQEREDHFFGGL